ncbi:MAG: 2-hydroxyacid dehydrogenase [Candidatus Omnitrophota bacterium]|nr:MAG: 2-hydroxyacid dehydrogenase [Candidatus Omnitrophota bacterium]
MKDKKIAFFDTKPYDREFFDQLNCKYGFSIKYFKGHLNNDIAGLTQGYDVVCCFVNDIIDSKVIAVLKQNRIKLIALRCAGYNNIDLQTVYGSINVVRVPAYSPYAVAEHAVALMLSLNRKTHKAYCRTRDGNFAISGLLGFDMHGKTAGVIGTGKIGKCLISILKGFGMNVCAYDLSPDPAYAKAAGIAYVGLAQLYKSVDIISLHCPLTPETNYMINEESISLMKNGVMIVNTGRGKLIKTQALIDGLKSGKIGSAGLDVYEEESEYFFEDYSSSLIKDDLLARLLIFPNVLVTSHQGFFTREALSNIADTTLSNIREFFDGGYLQNEICYRCGTGECMKKAKKRCF